MSVETSFSSQGKLVDAIVAATRAAVADLFREHPNDHFYYVALVTTGDARSPNLTAWSREALDAAVSQSGNDLNARAELKWSYADSPFYCFGDQHFGEVRRLFDALAPADPADAAEWQAAFAQGISAMEEALAQLDRSGLFGSGTARADVVINAECMPPDHTNVVRARRLNPSEALADWLKEAAEP